MQNRREFLKSIPAFALAGSIPTSTTTVKAQEKNLSTIIEDGFPNISSGISSLDRAKVFSHQGLAIVTSPAGGGKTAFCRSVLEANKTLSQTLASFSFNNIDILADSLGNTDFIYIDKHGIKYCLDATVTTNKYSATDLYHTLSQKAWENKAIIICAISINRSLRTNCDFIKPISFKHYATTNYVINIRNSKLHLIKNRYGPNCCVPIEFGPSYGGKAIMFEKHIENHPSNGII